MVLATSARERSATKGRSPGPATTVGAPCSALIRRSSAPARSRKSSTARIAVLDPAFVEQRRGADEVANIGDDPRLAGLDEGVSVKLPDILLDDVSLQVDHIKQRAQGLAARLVAARG